MTPHTSRDFARIYNEIIRLAAKRAASRRIDIDYVMSMRTQHLALMRSEGEGRAVCDTRGAGYRQEALGFCWIMAPNASIPTRFVARHAGERAGLGSQVT
jgi:hypothetical protein